MTQNTIPAGTMDGGSETDSTLIWSAQLHSEMLLTVLFKTLYYKM